MTRLTIPVPLRWSDFDPYGHVNNAAMLRLVEEARMVAFWRADLGTPNPPTAVLEGGPGVETLSIISRQEIEYLAEIPYMSRPIDVELWIGKMGGASFDVYYELYPPAGVEPRTLYARAATTLVMVAAATDRPVRITPEQKAVWLPIVEEPIRFSRRG